MAKRVAKGIDTAAEHIALEEATVAAVLAEAAFNAAWNAAAAADIARNAARRKFDEATQRVEVCLRRLRDKVAESPINLGRR